MLASIQYISNIEEIENADRVEKATVLGWSVVVRKNEYKIGDKCIFVEIDTLVPTQHLDFQHTNENKYIHIKTMKICNTLSQGIILPLNKLPNSQDLPINTDVSLLLNITHYQKDSSDNSQQLPFPSFVSKTGEIMIQSNMSLLRKLLDKPYYITIKYDGSSATYYNIEGKKGVCSRNKELKYSENCPYWKIAEKYNILEKLPNNIAIQGELLGPKICKNRYKYQEYEFRGFNIVDIKSGLKLQFNEMVDIFTKLEIPMVDIIEYGNTFKYDISHIEKIATAKYINYPTIEGIVIRSQDQTISFKYLNPNYLIYHIWNF